MERVVRYNCVTRTHDECDCDYTNAQKKKKKVHKGTERCDGTNRVLLLTGNRKQQKTQADNHKTASIIKCCII